MPFFRQSFILLLFLIWPSSCTPSPPKEHSEHHFSTIAHFLPYHHPRPHSPDSTGRFDELPQHFSSSQNRMARGCRHYCSLSDPLSGPCWNHTLHFYEQMVVGLLRRTIGTEINRVLWLMANQHLSQSQIDFAHLAKASFQRFMNLALKPQRVEDANDWKRADIVFERLCPAMVENVQLAIQKLMRNHYGGEWPRMSVECPHGCERSWEVWKWLCIGSLLCTLLLCASLLCLVFSLDQKERNAWTMEADEYAQNGRGIKVDSREKTKPERQIAKN